MLVYTCGLVWSCSITLSGWFVQGICSLSSEPCLRLRDGTSGSLTQFFNATISSHITSIIVYFIHCNISHLLLAIVKFKLSRRRSWLLMCLARLRLCFDGFLQMGHFSSSDDASS